MKKIKSGSRKAATLQKKTEKRLAGKGTNVEQLSNSDTRRLIDEMQLPQIKLETQHEELRSSHSGVQIMAMLPEENPNPVLRVDITGHIQYANKPAIDMFAALGSSPDGLLPDSLLHGVRRAIAEAVIHEIELSVSLHCVFSFMLVPSLNEGHVNLYGYDITKRKTAEKSLQKSEARFKLLSETAAHLLASTEPQTIVNELCIKVMEHLDCHAFFNFMADDAAGRLHLNAFAGIPEEEARKIEWLDYGVAVCGCAAAEGHRIVAEDIFCTNDPRTELVKSYGIQAYACHPIIGAGGRIIGTLSFGTRNRPTFTAEELDLMKTVANQAAIAMERMQAEQTLLQSEKRWRQLAEAMPQLVWTCTPDGLCDYLSAQWFDYTGISEVRQLGYAWLEQVHPDDREPLMAAWRKAVRTSDVFDVEFRIRRYDGTYRWFKTRAIPISDESGHIFKWYGSNTDINDLRESREDLNRAQAVAHTGSWRLNIQRNELLWSKENHRIFGVHEGTPMSYDTFLGIVHPQDREYVDRQWQAALRGEPYDIEHRIIADGIVKWVRERATLEFDGTGTLLGGFGTTQDITGHKQAELALEEARNEAMKEKNLLEAVMDAIPVGVAVTDLKGGTIRSNNMFEQIWGGPLPETRSTSDYATYRATWVENGRPVQPDEWASALAVKNDKPVIGQLFEIECFDGRQRYVLNSAAPFMDANGNIAGSAVAIQDISDRIAAEKALRESEQLYRAIGESIDYGVWVCEPDGRNLYASESFLNLVGLTQEQYSNFGWGDVLHPDDVEHTIAAWKDCVQNGGMWDIEHRFRGVDGQSHPVLARGVPVRDEHGRITKWAGINLDISRLKQAQYELQAAKYELEARVQERTDELTRSNKALHIEIEERKRIHDIVVKQTQLLESFFSSTITPLMFLDRHCNVIRVNEAYARAFQRDAHEFPGCNYFDIYPQPGLKEIFKSVVATGEPFEAVAMPFTFPDRPEIGTTYWDWTLTPLINEAGEVESLVYAMQGVTERIRSEEAVKAEHAFRKAIEDAVPSGLATVDLNGRLNYVNNSFCAMLGLTADELLGAMPPFAFWPPEELGTNAMVFQRYLSGEQSGNCEVRFQKRNGERVDILLTGSLMTDSLGSVFGLLASFSDITELKEAQRNQQQAADEILDLYNNAPCGYHSLNSDGIFIRINDTELSWLGYSRDEVMGTMKFSDVLTPASQRIFSESFPRFKERGFIKDQEFEMVRKNGSILPVLLNATAVNDAHGNFVMSRSTIYDITERKKADERIAQQAELLELAHDAIIVRSLNDELIYWNSGAERTYGWSREDALSAVTHDLLQARYPIPLEEVKAQVLRTGYWEGELTHRTSKGIDIIVESRWSLQHNRVGEPIAIFEINRDITLRKRMENELIQSEQRLKTAQKIARLGSWEWNLLSGEQLWSEEMYRIFGYDPEEITMSHDTSFEAIHPEDKEYVTQSVREALEAGTSYTIDFRIIRPDGAVRYLNSQAKLYTDDQGSPLRMVGLVLDITERKDIERKLQESGQQLRYLSAELMTAHEAERKRIAGEVHDELGQAMTVLKLRLRTIEKHLRKDQDNVRNECLDLLDYADGILKSVRRISRDLTPSILEDLGLSAAVRWLVDNFKENLDVNIALQAANIDYLVPKDLQINIYRILQECLTNSGKHAGAGNITVSIQPLQDVMLLTVEDDGRGFYPEQIFSVEAPLQGLGFTTMRERALLLNGKLDIASFPGKGTRITLQIPIAGS